MQALVMEESWLARRSLGGERAIPRLALTRDCNLPDLARISPEFAYFLRCLMMTSVMSTDGLA